jgi:tRNA dimethylallyltransferase
MTDIENHCKQNMESPSEEPPLIGIVGPTAVGKTAVAISLAHRLNGEIISADAVAVYRGLNIGSAKPDATERAEIAFYLVDVCHPDEDFTLADFQRLAEEAISDIRRRGKTPILVGGTGLYVRSVTATLNMPTVPPHPEIRRRLEDDAENFGLETLYARLKEVDSLSAAKVQSGDTRRIIRALEVWEVTGIPLSDFHTPEGVQGIPRPNVHLFGLAMNREALYQRIETRVDAMMAAGLEVEVRGLLAAGYDPSLKSLQSLGYRHMISVINGELSREQAVTELKRDTRRYAKRQLSWFNADARVRWLNAEKIETEGLVKGTTAIAEQVIEALQQIKQENPPDEGNT